MMMIWQIFNRYVYKRFKAVVLNLGVATTYGVAEQNIEFQGLVSLDFLLIRAGKTCL